MDPTSASVAFVGFAAGVATLAGLAAESWQTLYNLLDKLKHASEDLRRLTDKLRAVDLLLTELKKAVVNDDDVSADVKALWDDCSGQMEADLVEFNTLILHLKKKMDTESVSGFNVRMRVKWVFSDEKIKLYNDQLASHIQCLDMIQGSIVGLVCHDILAGTRALGLQLKYSQHTRPFNVTRNSPEFPSPPVHLR